MKIKGKIQDSKKRTREIEAIAALPLSPITRQAKMITPDKKPMSTRRGLVTLSRPDAMKRPIAKQP